ncbi:tyrosine--tRNA ligase [Candidatus Zinderia endosymbiont of Aphrophora alni]|uniref:tyrosine--tRNA ligase n=1 Tax=Candidatus Zinderia endosymbiont of Aphrophora alni TaxID=3077951 RepID=UPI0030CF648E
MKNFKKIFTKNLLIPDFIKDSLKIFIQNSKELLKINNFVNQLIFSYKKKIPLRIKFGCDPTSPNLHFGHLVVLNKLYQLQNLGHKIIIVIGDFSARIGDPTKCNVTRPFLSKEQVIENSKNYFSQIGLILDLDKIEIRYNSEWFNNFNIQDIIKLTSYYTVARMIERDDFSKRLKLGFPIFMHEFLYPLFQGYDSIILKSHLEIGGSDQKFNLLIARNLQKNFGGVPQNILTMPILEGLDGVHKMSKSKKNFINIVDDSYKMFSKIMSISDKMMWKYYKLLLLYSKKKISSLKKSIVIGSDLKKIKISLALKLVTKFHSLNKAKKALFDFINCCKGGVPKKIDIFYLSGAPLLIGNLLKKVNFCFSFSEALRMIMQKGVRINGNIVTDKFLKINSGIFILQVGKRKFLKIHLIK